jgi:ribosome-binding factor A
MTSRRSNDRFDDRDAPALHLADRKTRQLCAQVHEVVSMALAECDDRVLEDVFVEAVEPAPAASRLCVVVSAPEGTDAPETLLALARVRNRLRREITAAIHRKRTPELTFRLARR